LCAYGIISDIHGNLEALDAVLEVLDQAKVDRLFCLGDVVGYGADPGICIARLRDRKVPTVLGNHDAAAMGRMSVECFNPHARASVVWTRKQLTGEELRELGDLPLVRREEGFTLVHATLHSPERFGYILTNLDAYFSFQLMDHSLCFVGHSHVPIKFFQSTPLSYNTDPVVRLDPAVKTIVNVGSVGQPRDRNPQACYAIWDSDEGSVRIERVDYDIDSAAQKIRDAGLPAILADRLYEGI
jgi:diadenosine tetraphosphatase ApaH/serine/threonine PP2A family protein phosphatase